MNNNSTSAHDPSVQKVTSLVQAIYTSRSLIGEDQQSQLLAECRVKNPKNDVSGVLVSHDEKFLQVLEGPASHIRTLIGKIEKDPRHTEFHVIGINPISQRNFPDWSMASLSLDPMRFTQLVDDCMAGGNEALENIRDFLCYGIWKK